MRLGHGCRDTSQSGILSFHHETRDGTEVAPVAVVQGDQVIALFAPANATRVPSSSIQPMPVRIHDAWRLANLAGDQRHLLVGNSTHVNRDVQQIVG